ncbi:MAG: preprotein translocase subunit SecG [Thiovulaceae bacterium]|nr:preprotein translocase subunit SecG [Sulfurimonadaceae bacterium]
MENVLIISMIVVAALITVAVLLQKSSSIGLGAYSGSNESVFGAKGPASFLAKTTFILGFVFVVLTITLGVVYNEKKDASVTDNVPRTQAPTAPTIPAAPVAPAAK